MKKAKRNKEIKSLELFKKGFRKNEIVIYAIALMLVTAGYFNYTANVENNIIETSTIESTNILTNDDENNKDKNKNEETTKETAATNEDDRKESKNESIGDAKLVSNNDVNDYFVNTKLERDTNYADMLSNYTKIIQDNSISETQKSIAMKEITKINETKNAISVCENILSTKGFEQYVILVNNDSVNVVIGSKEKLSKEKVAQIQNIVSREMKSEIENIHIMEK